MKKILKSIEQKRCFMSLMMILLNHQLVPNRWRNITMKKAKLFGSLTLLSGVALTLAACGNNSNSKVDNPTKSFKEATPNPAFTMGVSLCVALQT